MYWVKQTHNATIGSNMNTNFQRLSENLVQQTNAKPRLPRINVSTIFLKPTNVQEGVSIIYSI